MDKRIIAYFMTLASLGWQYEPVLGDLQRPDENFAMPGSGIVHPMASNQLFRKPEKHLYELAEELDWPMTIGILGLASATAGVAGLYLSSWIGRITGRWPGGTATSSQLRQALAWSMVPQIWISPLAPLTLLLFGREWFEEAKPTIEGSEVLSLAYGLLVAIQFVVGIWTIVINMKAIGEAHGFSAWKALLSSLLAAVLIIVTLAVAFFVLIFGVVFIRSLAA